MQAELGQVHAAAEQRHTELLGRLKKLEEELVQARRQLAEGERLRGEQESASKSSQQHAEQSIAALEEAIAAAQGHEAELHSEREELLGALKAAQRSNKEAGERQAQLEQDRIVAEGQLKEAATAQAELQRQLDDARAVAERDRVVSEGQLKEAATAQAELQKQLDEARAVAERDRVVAEGQLKEAATAQAGLQKQLDEARAVAEREREAAKARIAELQKEAEAALVQSGEEAARTLGQEITNLRVALERAESGAEAQRERLQAELDAIRRQGEEQAAELSAGAGQLRDELTRSQAAAAQQADVQSELEHALRGAQERVQGLEAQLAQATAEGGAAQQHTAGLEQARAELEQALAAAEAREAELVQRLRASSAAPDEEAQRLTAQIEELRTRLQDAERLAADHTVPSTDDAEKLIAQRVAEEVAKATAQAEVSRCYLEQETGRLGSELEQANRRLEEEVRQRRAAETGRRAAQQEADKLRAETQVIRNLVDAQDGGAPSTALAERVAELEEEIKSAKKNVEVAVRLRNEAEAARRQAEAEAGAVQRQLRAQGESVTQVYTPAVAEESDASPSVESAPVPDAFPPEPPDSRRHGGVLGLVAGVLVAFAFGSGAYLWMARPPAVMNVLSNLLNAHTARQSRVDVGNITVSGSGNGPASAPAPILRPGRTFRDPMSDGGSGPLMVEVPATATRVGSASNSLNFDERPQHEVRTRGFAIGVHEVTFADYDRFAAATGRRRPEDAGWGRGDRPVINVSWKDAVAYTQWLSEQTGHLYRLPSEAEWELAASAGAETFYWWGNDIGIGNANCFNCGSAWDALSTAPVGSFHPNALGIYDTAGNAMEWVQDCYHPNYEGAPGDASVWEGGDCTRRISRGGSYANPADNLRTQKRTAYLSESRLDNLGFRVVRER